PVVRAPGMGDVRSVRVLPVSTARTHRCAPWIQRSERVGVERCPSRRGGPVMAVSTHIAEATAAAPNGEGPGQTVQTITASEVPATSRNLYQRINAVRLALGGTIAKGGQAPQVMGGFTFVAWDDVAAKVGTLMAENGIVMLPSMPASDVVQAGTTANGKPIYRATVTLVYELVNADDPRERTTMTW